MADVSVTATLGTDQYKTVVKSQTGHRGIADEPEALGGTDLGFAPDEWLAAALASCSIITMRMYANRKAWPLERIEVQVSMERRAQPASTHFEKTVKFTGNLTAEQQQRLLEIGNRCPVHRSFLNPITISAVLTV
ncbi:MAG TPA: OsmC family protein [Phnomibacter sp.]|nr:OsmC family protein [Phnomibacter sp.]